MHQDAHEFFNFLLNKVVEDLEVEAREAREKGLEDREFLFFFPFPFGLLHLSIIFIMFILIW